MKRKPIFVELNHDAPAWLTLVTLALSIGTVAILLQLYLHP